MTAQTNCHNCQYPAPNGRNRPNSALAYLKRRVAEHAGVVVKHIPGARRGEEPEDLHMVRVGCRRLRETLRAIQAMAPARAIERCRLVLRRVTHAAGRIRELDVAREYLRSRRSSIPPAIRRALGREIDAILCGWIRAERARLRGVLYLAEFRRLARAADAATAPSSADESFTARSIVKRRMNQAGKRYRKIRGRMDVRRIHLFRIAVKKLRYAVEILEPFLAHKWSGRLRRIKKLQGLLGRLHDDYVTANIFRKATRKAGEAAREPMRQTDLAMKQDYKQQFRRLKHMRMPWKKQDKN